MLLVAIVLLAIPLAAVAIACRMSTAAVGGAAALSTVVGSAVSRRLLLVSAMASAAMAAELDVGDVTVAAAEFVSHLDVIVVASTPRLFDFECSSAAGCGSRLRAERTRVCAR